MVRATITPAFPGTTVTQAQLGLMSNFVRTTIPTALASNTTTFTVSSGTGIEIGMIGRVLSTTGVFELMQVTGVSGTSVTVTRAVDGTTAAATGANVDILFVAPAFSYNQLSAEVIAIEAFLLTGAGGDWTRDTSNGLLTPSTTTDKVRIGTTATSPATRLSVLATIGVYGSAGDANPIVELSSAGLQFGPGGATPVNSTFFLASGKNLTVSNTLTFTGTDGSSAAFGTGGTVAYVANNLGVFAATTSAQLAGVISDETGSGALVFANTPSLVTPVLGAATATSINGLTLTSSTGTLTVANGKTVSFADAFATSGAFATTLTVTGTTSLTLPTSGTVTALGNTTTGSGSIVLATGPTLVTPVLGAATATSINGLTITSSTGTLTIANAKTLTVSNILTFTGTDSSSVAFGAGGTVTYTTNNLSVFAATTSAQLAGVISDETGSGALVFATSPSIATPTITGGTITLGTVTNISGANVVIGSISGNFGNFNVSSDGVLDSYLSRASNDTNPAFLHLQKMRGTHASKSDIANGDFIGVIEGDAYSGGTFFATAAIYYSVDGAFTSGQRPPSRISFYTNTANGAQTEVMSVDSAGRLGLGGHADTNTIFKNIGSVTAAGTRAYGNRFIPTLTAAANNDVMCVLAIDGGTMAHGAFTGVEHRIAYIDGTSLTVTGAGGTSVGYALYLNAPTGFATNYALYIGSGSAQFGGNVGFYANAPVAQPSSAGNTNYTDSGATVVHTAGTFTGGTGATAYTTGDIVRALKLLGLIAL